MTIVWGTLMALVGVFFISSATLYPNFFIYRLLVARSQMLWGDHVHLFYQGGGGLLIILGLLWAFGIIWHK